MPNRYVREDAIESDRVNALSWQGEVFFRRLINRVDDFGRYSASLALLRATIFPLQLDRVSEKDVERLLKEAEANGLLATYEDGGKRFLALAKWEHGRALKSKYPPPPEEICKHLQTFVYRSEHLKADVPDTDSDSVIDSDTDKAALEALKVRIGGWFKRRPTTPWSSKEIKALKDVIKLGTPPEDIDLLERRYMSGDQYLRREIITLLNNWNGEIDRARGLSRSPQPQLELTKPKRPPGKEWMDDPNDWRHAL